MLSLIHPFTPESCGVDESDVPRFWIPVFSQLKELASKMHTSCEVVFLGSGKARREIVHQGLVFRFYPRALNRARGFGREWSISLLKRMLVSPPKYPLLYVPSGGLAYAVALILKAMRRRYLVIIGGYVPEAGKKQLIYLRGATGVVVQTRKQRDIFIRYGISPARIFVIPNSVDSRLFHDANKSYGSLEGPRLLYVGRLLPGKGALDAVEIFFEVQKELPGASLELIGPAADQEYLASITAFIEDRGIGSKVGILGSVAHSRLQPFFSGADLLLLPSRSESFGKVLIEAMACGTPPVAFRGSGGPDEVISHGVDGLLVGPEDAATRVVALLKDPERLKEMGRSGVEKVAREFSYEMVTAMWERALRSSFPALGQAR